MSRPRAHVRTLGFFVTLVALADPSSLRADQPADSLIGAWVLNRAKSKYVTSTPPQSIVRTFDYTRDGQILVTLNTIHAQGASSSTHWYLSLDGREHPEFSRGRGATPILWISMQAINSRTLDLTGRRLENGVLTVVDLMRFTVSPDSQSLTITYTDPKTGREGNVVVYDRQP
jgi:hypothetical protein